MNLTVSIPPEAEARLLERASEAGLPPETLASRLLEQAVQSPTLAQVLAPVSEAFAKSGLSEEELAERGRRALDRLRSSGGGGR